jgi:hypothetical protein
MKFTTTIVGAALGAFLSLAASAAPITLPAGLIQLSDNDAEYLINSDGSRCNPSVPSTCTVDQGDRLRGIFDINSIEGLSTSSPATFTPFNGNEITGIFDITAPLQPARGYGPFTFTPTGKPGVAGGRPVYYDPQPDCYRSPVVLSLPFVRRLRHKRVLADSAFGPGSYRLTQASRNDISADYAIMPPTRFEVIMRRLIFW